MISDSFVPGVPENRSSSGRAVVIGERQRKKHLICDRDRSVQCVTVWAELRRKPHRS
jgi:hypothetical protein